MPEFDLPNETCPKCGCEMVFTVERSDGLIADGDELRCDDCPHENTLSVDENGNHWLQDY